MPRPARKAQAVHAAPAQSISSFTRVSKSSALLDNAATKKSITATTTTSRKRKASSIEDDHVRLGRRTVSYPPSSDDELTTPKRTCRRVEPQPDAGRVLKPAAVPTTKGKRTAKAPVSRTESAHKPSTTTVIAQSKQQRRTIQTKLDAFQKKNTDAANKRKTSEVGDDTLPPHLADLLRLHRAFLKTVMMKFAHNGNNSPLDIRALAPDVSRTWGKRRVTIEDIRRCVAIQSSAKHGDTPSSSPFIITDYGRGKVCVELSPDCDASTVHEDRLCKKFAENLHALCAERAADEMTDVDISFEGLCLADLPQADITDMDAGNKLHPQLSKGQRALSELKNGIAAKQQDREAKQSAAAANPRLNPDGSKMSLLDRLRLKQMSRAGGPEGPTGPELQRRAALNRVADVAATISMLSLTTPISLPRQAFTMAVILDKLRDSLRVPMSKEEGAVCVKLIAAEIAPEWLKVVAIGGRENVVVQRNGQPVDRIIHERVQKLLG